MFGTMKEALRGRRFSSDEEAIGAVQNWLKTQPKKKKKNFFLALLKKLVKSWSRCAEVDGDYIEK
jgi:hypothetical protein